MSSERNRSSQSGGRSGRSSISAPTPGLALCVRPTSPKCWPLRDPGLFRQRVSRRSREWRSGRRRVPGRTAPAHKFTRPNDFKDLPALSRSLATPKEWGSASSASSANRRSDLAPGRALGCARPKTFGAGARGIDPAANIARADGLPSPSPFRAFPIACGAIPKSFPALDANVPVAGRPPREVRTWLTDLSEKQYQVAAGLARNCRFFFANDRALGKTFSLAF